MSGKNDSSVPVDMMNQKIDSLEKFLDQRMDGFESTIESLKKSLYVNFRNDITAMQLKQEVFDLKIKWLWAIVIGFVAIILTAFAYALVAGIIPSPTL